MKTRFLRQERDNILNSSPTLSEHEIKMIFEGKPPPIPSRRTIETWTEQFVNRVGQTPVSLRLAQREDAMKWLVVNKYMPDPVDYKNDWFHTQEAVALSHFWKRALEEQQYAAESDKQNAEAAPKDSDPLVRYIAYPKAMKRLIKRLDATPGDMAAWVWIGTKADALNRLNERKKRKQTPLELESDLKDQEHFAQMGPKDCGLAAYLNANEPYALSRFRYSYSGREDTDYIPPLMACWFREDDIATFNPVEYYITGEALSKRWSELGERLGIRAEKFILDKIKESRLWSLNPLYSSMQGIFEGDASLPLLKSMLFKLSQVEKIEAEDFGEDKSKGRPTSKARIDAIEKARDYARDYYGKKGNNPIPCVTLIKTTDFITTVFPGKELKQQSVLDERTYTNLYGVSPRAIVSAISKFHPSKAGK